MFFDELSNDEWALLSALVSDEPAVRLNRRGRPRAEPRIVANAVLWILTTGEPWSRLPGRYPSGPTCRRRFEEWQLNGTLAEMIRLLSETGRTFAYVPEPAVAVSEQDASPSAPGKEAAATREHREARDEGQRGVYWKSPESWQAPGRVAEAWQQPADPFAEIARQLSSPLDETPTRIDPHAVASPSHQHDDACPHRALGAGGEQGAGENANVCARSPLWMGMSAPGNQLADRRGYVIYVMAQSVPNQMYRAWAEIMKDGKRVERSGLVGPRFETPEAAERHAFEWAQQWIDRHCRMLAAAARGEPVTASTQPASTPVSRPMPAPRPAVTGLPAAPSAAPVADATAKLRAAVAAEAPGVNPAKSQVQAQPKVHVNANVSARRITLRRYPGESTADAGSDRFCAASELLSHPG